MTRRVVVGVGLAIAIAIVAMATFAFAFAWRTRADAVGPRFVEALLGRHPGTTVEGWDAGVLRVALASGVYLDVRVGDIVDACAADRLHCGDAIDRALDDVDAVDRATRAPQPAMLGPAVVAETTPGFRFGFVTEPLLGAIELRYVEARGVASTFVTGAMADLLGMKPAALKQAALAMLSSQTGVTLQPVDGTSGVFRVRSDGEPVASLLDAARMRRFAAELHATRLYAAIPSRRALYLAKADPPAATSLLALIARERGGRSQSRDVGLLAYDVDAPDGRALSLVGRP